MTELSQRETASKSLRRSYRTQFEVRTQANNKATITGYASVYEEPYEMYDWLGSYTEVVRAGAGSKTLSESPMVQLLLNHAGLPMAATRGGTLKLSEDSTGLAVEADVNLAQSNTRDVVTALMDGNLEEMSFAFVCTKQMWSPDYAERSIIEYNINRGDVSVVNFGANPATSVDAAMRAQDLDRMSEPAARALFDRLAVRLGTSPATTLTADLDPVLAAWALVG